MLKSQIESILFVLGKPISLKALAKLSGRSVAEVEVVLEDLKIRYNQPSSGIHILSNNKEVQMVINSKNGALVEDIVKEEIISELTQPQLETLTIIAYRGPITKLELEQIRGVNCSLILKNLIIKDLIEVEENKIIEQNKYWISPKFMRHLGIDRVENLPDYENLSQAESLDETLVMANQTN